MSRGRGRGRGRGKSFGGLEALSIIPGEPIPPPILQPPPLFPLLAQKPLELRSSKSEEYLLSVKQDLRQFMRQSPFHLKAGSDKKVIERYSDKYRDNNGSELDNILDWEYFPKELQTKRRKRKRREVGLQYEPVVPASKRTKRETPKQTKDRASVGSDAVVAELLQDETDMQHKKVTFSTGDGGPDINKQFEHLERTEQAEADNESGEEAWTGDDEYYDEEIQEEGTDYNVSYFDNGEEYGGDEDDALEEGPCY